MPVLAALGFYIAYLQWRTAELKRNYELFDRRYTLYQKVLDYLQKIWADYRPCPEEIAVLHAIRSESLFLCGTDVADYIQKLIRVSAELYHNRIWIESDRISDDDKMPYRHEMQKTIGYLREQSRELEAAFLPYLGIEQSVFSIIFSKLRLIKRKL